MKIQTNIIVKPFIWLIISIITGFVIMVSVYCLPTSRIEKNVEKSISQFKDEMSPAVEWAHGYKTTQLDNIGDALMLLNACNPVNNILQDAMLNKAEFYGTIYSTQAIVSKFSPEHPQAQEVPYPRYWHGYLAFIKPLLLLFNYQEIRLLNYFLQFSLLMYIFYLMLNKIDKKYIIAFFITIITINSITTAISLQNSTIYYTMLISIIVILKFNDKMLEKQFYTTFFLLVGAFTSFVDFLTYPLVSLGIPLTLFYIINKYQINRGGGTKFYHL